MEAAILDAEISGDETTEIELIRGAGGVFDVTADGELLFSKHDSGRFPDNDEILDRLKRLVAT